MPHKISQEIENLLYRFPSNQLNLEQIAEFHTLFERIHPFSDGNGRTGRLLMSFQCIQNNLIPPLIENENRGKYLECLESCQINNDFKEFALFLEYCQMRSLELIGQIQQDSFTFYSNQSLDERMRILESNQQSIQEIQSPKDLTQENIQNLTQDPNVTENSTESKTRRTK